MAKCVLIPKGVERYAFRGTDPSVDQESLKDQERMVKRQEREQEQRRQDSDVDEEAGYQKHGEHVIDPKTGHKVFKPGATRKQEAKLRDIKLDEKRAKLEGNPFHDEQGVDARVKRKVRKARQEPVDPLEGRKLPQKHATSKKIKRGYNRLDQATEDFRTGPPEGMRDAANRRTSAQAQISDAFESSGARAEGRAAKGHKVALQDMPHNKKTGMNTQIPKVERHTAPPGMEHVVKALKKKHGINPFAVAWSMYNKDQQKHRALPLGVEVINPPPGLFKRNLQTLDWIANNRYQADTRIIEQLHKDAVADLKKQYGGVIEDEVDFEDVWKHVLDSVKQDALEALSKNSMKVMGRFEIARPSQNRLERGQVHSEQGIPESAWDGLEEMQEQRRRCTNDVLEEMTGKGKGIPKRDLFD